jgi:tight adherence protein C
MTMLLPLLAFLFATGLIAFAGMRLATNRGTVIERRLQEVTSSYGRETDAPRPSTMKALLKRVGERMPQSPKDMSKMRLRLMQAGYRNQEALAVFFGARVALALLMFVLLATPIVMRPNVLAGMGGAFLGYAAAGFLLARRAKARQHKIQLGLADALDLLVVSVEAGLGLDQALLRVGEELQMAHPDLADELKLVNLELRAGKGRSEALRNLGERTGLEDVISLVTMLVQTDKFGTSVTQSLRVHSDVLRTKRRQRAEEAAAKTGVKMVFPLVFCIFPAIWVVTIGPAAIKFVQVLFPMVDRSK